MAEAKKTNALQRKRAANKAKRDAEKAERKAKNIARVTGQSSDSPKAAPKKQQPTTGKVRDVWHKIELEKQGIDTFLDEDGNECYTMKARASTTPGKKVRSRPARRHLRKRGHHYGNLVCVKTRKGDKVRVRFDEADRLVAEGGSFIPKHEFKAEWEHKK